MAVCYHCGKGVIFGRSHTHHRGVAGGRWKKRAQKTPRLFKPNLQKMNILVNGKTKRVKICMQCLKTVKKDLKEGVKPRLEIIKSTPKPIAPVIPKPIKLSKIKKDD